MSRRVEVDEESPPVRIPNRILNELFAHARDALPEECCGLILGVDADRFRRLVRCRNEATERHLKDPKGFPRDGRSAFYMSHEDHERTEQEARAAGERVTAVYHSHVGAGAYLSEMDLDYAEHDLFPFPDAAQIVIAVLEGQVDGAGFFERPGRQAPFAGRPIEHAGP